MAAAMLERALGASVELTRDRGHPPRQVDGYFTLPTGIRGALEVTTLARPVALETERLIATGEWAIPKARWAWIVQVPAATSMVQLRRFLPEIVLACEAAGVTDPRMLAWRLRGGEAFRWLAASGVSLFGSPESTRPGAIDVVF